MADAFMHTENHIWDVVLTHAFYVLPQRRLVSPQIGKISWIELSVNHQHVGLIPDLQYVKWSMLLNMVSKGPNITTLRSSPVRWSSISLPNCPSDRLEGPAVLRQRSSEEIKDNQGVAYLETLEPCPTLSNSISHAIDAELGQTHMFTPRILSTLQAYMHRNCLFIHCF